MRSQSMPYLATTLLKTKLTIRKDEVRFIIKQENGRCIFRSSNDKSRRSYQTVEKKENSAILNP
jgi:hypothetical protein